MNNQNLNEKISKKANEFLQYFKKIKRNENEEFYTLEDQAPSELKELVREAHGDFLPDDFRYRTICDALYAFADCGSDQNLDEIRLEPDIYYHDLLKWLSSNLKRVFYCDEAISEFGLEKVDTMVLITHGQQFEKDEVIFIVRNLLINFYESK